MERKMIVCDGLGEECGEPAPNTVWLKSNGKGLSKDLCDEHHALLFEGAHKPRRGRRPANA